MERPGTLVVPINVFSQGIPFDGDIDVDWFCNIPSAAAASARLDFLRAPLNQSELMKRGYGHGPMDRMWASVYRACIGFGVPIPSELRHHADLLGVIIP